MREQAAVELRGRGRRAGRSLRTAMALGLTLGAGLVPVAAQEVIRLRTLDAGAETEEPERLRIGAPRQGFDYAAFEARLESLWFQRKTFLANGRPEEARAQLEQIQAFCAQEGIHRLEAVASALIVEARRHLAQGDHQAALDTLRHAEALDPGRPQIRRARASALWQGGHGLPAAVSEWLAAQWGTVRQQVEGLGLVAVAILLGTLAASGGLVLFALVALLRHQAPLRHEVWERLAPRVDEPWARAAGWAVLGLPLLLWVGAGWAVAYWIVITFRFMSRAERWMATALLLAGAVALPGMRLCAALYGLSADPATRTAVTSANGEYDPDRIMKLRQLVESHPEDPVYHFLLAGLYKNGRYLEEAFLGYKRALALAPELVAAQINIGNIFFATGQYAEALVYYRRAAETDPDSFLAFYNMHLAQSEAFRFRDAEASLARAREIDASRVARTLAATAEEGRAGVVDATLGLDSRWQAALLGGLGRQRAARESTAHLAAWIGALLAPAGIGLGLAAAAAWLTLLAGRGARPARSCIRCGRPFCRLCTSDREAREYCSQCLHLFVLGDGLAAQGKARKLYEIERHERLQRRLRSLLSLLIPGTAQLLRGNALRGSLLAVLWLSALIAWQPGMLALLERLVRIDVHEELLMASVVPPLFQVEPLRLVGLVALPCIWWAANGRGWRRKEAA